MGVTNEIQKRAGQLAKGGFGVLDKASGTVKSVAGDLLGRADLRRQGVRERAKGEAKQDLAAQEARVESAKARADVVEREARDQAAEAAQREFARADRRTELEEARVEAAEEEADRREQQVEALEEATDPEALAESHTRDELDRQAQELGVTGRSQMTKDELAREIVERR